MPGKGLSALTLELDLIGNAVTLTDSEAGLLLAAAEAGSGSSIGSRDLATRLKGLADPATTMRRQLVLTRPESRALQRLIQTQSDTTGELHDLRAALTDLLAC
jgi:hypothetical protein